MHEFKNPSPHPVRLSEPKLGALGQERVFKDSHFLNDLGCLKSFQPVVLGMPGSDNALYVKANTGQASFRALFDCGAQCLSALPVSEVSKVDVICFSHLHFDHIAGFDHFLRLNFDRANLPVHIFGPPRTAEILHHRLQGVLWDRVDGSLGNFFISELAHGVVSTYQFKSSDGFKTRALVDTRKFDGRIAQTKELFIDAVQLDHGSPSMGYSIGTAETQVVDSGKLRELGLKGGPWLQKVKDVSVDNSEVVLVGDAPRAVGELRAVLLSKKPGERIGYLTDFRHSPQGHAEIAKVFHRADFIVCENNYGDADAQLAEKNFHMTSSHVASLAEAIDPRNLILFHLSDRYTPAEWVDQLERVRQKFPRAYLPSEWKETLQRSFYE